MTQEDKELLLKDLCGRLSYGVKVAFFNEDLTHHSEHKTLVGIECINNLNYSRLEDEDGNTTIIEFIKPYLFPLSSMSDEQLPYYITTLKYSEETRGMVETSNSFDWLNKNHFDYRGLIDKNLAIDATGLNIY